MEQDSYEKDLEETRTTLQSMLVPGESVLAFAVQRRLFALSHRRMMVAATSGRLLVISRWLDWRLHAGGSR
ncbi:hypothetical protein [Paraburkholderia fungorum]|uniref:hypothetical protein n=1 Tax=Paraburkholderia fungorum TaxID=134537 RepID=UPI0038BB890C